MIDEKDAFEGWAILELMGHRRLAGHVRAVEIAGAGMLRLDVPSGCTGVAASWCPVHGDCKCPDGPERNDAACPLHKAESGHGEAVVATQFYSPASLYCLTPTTQEIATTIARRSRPAPAHRWELPPAPAVTVPPDDDPDPAEDLG